MGLSIGIVGLPNVGKSTTFNALTKTQNAEAANYPFCTIEPNKAVVPVPDPRLEELAKIVNPKRIQHSVVEFVDIAGLVKGASKGEGLGNQFLANIRECECILHVIRCFEDENITHVEGKVNPLHDSETIELELIYADLGSLDKRIQKLQKGLKASKDGQKELDLCLKLKTHLEDLKPASTFKSEGFDELNKELRLLSAKEMIYALNVDEDSLSNGGNAYTKSFLDSIKELNRDAILICSKLEEDMLGMEDSERDEFLKDMGVTSGLAQIIQKSYSKLGLISYFTAGVQEVRSWSIKDGDSAPRAASVIHKDFEKGFIRAETISYSDFIKCGGEKGAKDAGLMRLEGKEYIVKDGDVMHFRFNV
ncbi:redox-regulated ATPase YchF [Helicobacter sp. 11S02629-2]|uniref:redox-regulated ATPase YchF n=1 Tax=Helicobacter sp. 11S02629-2 TaxID=1476195 RepID=UPI000BA5CA7D|nr:redox-regulated ATPase YchF [Helicobacter sp. 11S02629-2]PAF44067.1 redox-regulated ATPase YchF [Helicobacter sp. 11S02629-2]